MSAVAELLNRVMREKGWTLGDAEREVALRNRGRDDVAKVPKSNIHRLTQPLSAGEHRDVSDRTIRALARGFGIEPWVLKQAALQDAGWQIFAGSEPDESLAVLTDLPDLLPEQRDELRRRMHDLLREYASDED